MYSYTPVVSRILTNHLPAFQKQRQVNFSDSMVQKYVLGRKTLKMTIVLRLKLHVTLLYTTRIGYENTHEMRAFILLPCSIFYFFIKNIKFRKENVLYRYINGFLHFCWYAKHFTATDKLPVPGNDATPERILTIVHDAAYSHAPTWDNSATAHRLPRFVHGP